MSQFEKQIPRPRFGVDTTVTEAAPVEVPPQAPDTTPTLSASDSFHEEIIMEADPAPAPVVQKEQAPEKSEVKMVDFSGLTEVKELADPAPQVIQDHEVFGPGYVQGNDTIALPPLRHESIPDVLDAMMQSDILKTPEGKRWFEYLRASTVPAIGGATMQATVDNPDAEFRQTIDHEGRRLSIGPVTIPVTPGARLSGEQAIFRAQAMTGLGGVFQIPLWHSGFWVTVRAPMESELLELNRRLGEEKIQLGRLSYGEAYSNMNVFYSAIVLDFIIDHLWRTSLAPEAQEKMRDLIKVQDIPVLAWGMAAAIYPDGFQYVRSVVGDENNPTGIISQKLKIPRLLWVNNRMLSDWQRQHMSNRQAGRMTLESIERYQSEFTIGQERVITVQDEVRDEATGDILKGAITMTLKSPNMDEFLSSGERWLNGIISQYDYSAGQEVNNQEREIYLHRHATASLARQYGHWVKEIGLGDNPTEEGTETVESVLTRLSGDLNILARYFEAVKEFQADSTIALVAVPTTDDKEAIFPRHPKLFPIDPMSVFFILLVQRIAKIKIQ